MGLNVRITVTGRVSTDRNGFRHLHNQTVPVRMRCTSRPLMTDTFWIFCWSFVRISLRVWIVTAIFWQGRTWCDGRSGGRVWCWIALMWILRCIRSCGGTNRVICLYSLTTAVWLCWRITSLVLIWPRGIVWLETWWGVYGGPANQTGSKSWVSRTPDKRRKIKTTYGDDEWTDKECRLSHVRSSTLL